MRRFLRRLHYGDTRTITRFAFLPKRFVDFDTGEIVVVWWERYRVCQRWEHCSWPRMTERAHWKDCTFQLGADDVEEAKKQLSSLRSARERLDADIEKHEQKLEATSAKLLEG